MERLGGEVGFPGTFDPLHGAHIGQMLRAYRFRPFVRVRMLMNKYPAHKPNITEWQHRLAMAHLTLQAIELPFSYELKALERPESGLEEEFDYELVGIDSVLDDMAEERRWKFIQRWPLRVMSVPGIPDSALTEAYKALPAAARDAITYEYVSETSVPILNYDFDARTFITRRIHSTGLRAGEDQSLLPLITRDYITQHGLYRPVEG